ncbi:MBT domain-containing protein 1 [Galendromus occidentalis]|uniref:MBT domain-containing protein 1 n=1 Tax=Galendromus occidentalis TaxID=34638 RepID=A0AAJ6W0B0_9ACAR|nr:MBT domain-containing protein 1 [Galendromus occidentalis]
MSSLQSLSTADRTPILHFGDEPWRDSPSESVSLKRDMSTERLFKPCSWGHLLESTDFETASVAEFVSAPLASRWAEIVREGVYVEVQNATRAASTNEIAYWLAVVIKVHGYFVKLRYLGCDDDSCHDFWMNTTSEIGVVGGTDYTIHPVGWSVEHGEELHPPKEIENSREDWISCLSAKLADCSTIPKKLHEAFRLATRTSFSPGMKLEAVDIRDPGCLREASVGCVSGRRLEVQYVEDGTSSDSDASSFWCHDSSTMIRPVGWAKLIGQDIRSTQRYFDTSLGKILANRLSDEDAPVGCFTPLHMLEKQRQSLDAQELKVGMKLEFFTPQCPDAMCIGTIRKVLRNHFLVVEADDVSAPEERLRMCVHALSNCLYPAGYAQIARIRLKKPPGYEERCFRWKEYLDETRSNAAPAEIFAKEVPDHGFQVGQMLEATDVLAPEDIRVARIERVVDRLLLIHFEGFPCDYDQWVDCESPDIFPVGWCNSVRYRLTDPGGGSQGVRALD